MHLPFRTCAFFVLAVAVGWVAAERTPTAAQSGGRILSYDQVFGVGQPGRAPGTPLLQDLPAIVGWLDPEHFLESREQKGERRVFAVSAVDGRATLHLDYARIQSDLPPGFNARQPAAGTPDLRQFVFSHERDLYYYDARRRAFKRLTESQGEELNPRFSPDARWIAYTRDHDLFAYDLDEGVEHRYTFDGSETVYNGYASWVYFEEILGRASRYAAFWWSPDSSRLAFMRFDDGPVPVFPIYHADGQHGVLERQRYPKAGDPNPYVQMGVVRVGGGPVVWMDFDPKADHYIAWPFWTPDSRTLMVQWMNRGQDIIRFYDCDPETGKKVQIFEERQPSWVTFFEELHYLRDGSGFLLRSDVSGWDHLYYYGMDGALRRQLTDGEWRVTSIERVDERSGWVYFLARPEGRSWDTQLMRVRLDGGPVQTLTTREGTYATSLSPDGRYFIGTVSTLTAPSSRALHGGDGTLIRPLGEAATPALKEYAWGRTELFTIPSEDGGFQLPAYWFLPSDFDPARKYPVIVSIYGGPDAGRVRNAWPGLQGHYWAQRGVITISVDHRGSGHFGKRGVALMHRNLGKWEMIDLAAAARWLRKQPFVAADRIGITGGSYGGYVTLLALTKESEHFNFGQAGSSVTDWQLYDTVYTERYMDTPAENPEGYRNGSVLTWMDRYRGGLRITHGTVDDNVHMQNSMQVIEWLTSNNRRFDMMLYPNSRHGIAAAQRAHFNREGHDFWVRTLLDGEHEPAAPTRQPPTRGRRP